ncbi:S8 family serine peptidase [Thalassotalea maritima]|uniref:S8 family serine peptidase n=1 Tax=Thalassotalea maritima TaxID=3242416 RepID=UPI0035282132
MSFTITASDSGNDVATHMFDKTTRTLPSNSNYNSRNIDNLYAIILTKPGLLGADLGANIASSSMLGSGNTRVNIHSRRAQGYISDIQLQQQALIHHITASSKQKITLLDSFKYTVNGFTARLTEQQRAALNQHSQVRFIQKIQVAKRHTDIGPTNIGADRVWSGLISETSSGYQGEGVIIGIIDSGINAMHPSFAELDTNGYRHQNPLGDGVFIGDCQFSEYQHYCNNKLIGIWSHPDITSTNTYPGDDPIGLDIDGHGTHVASIAAGNTLNNVPIYNTLGDKTQHQFAQISGVAPKANIVSYQVCDLAGCYPDLTVLAVEHAIEHGINVLNYSVGSPSYSPWQAIDALAFLTARNAGIHVAVSAGNGGNNGAKTINSPANAPWLTSVGASDHGRSYTAKTLTFSGGDSSLADITGYSATKGISASIVDGEEFNNGNCLSPFPLGSLTNKVVVCRRGDIARVAKGNNALAGGAAGMILINNPSGQQTLFSDHHVLPSAHISAYDGQNLVQWLTSGSNHQISFNDSSVIVDTSREDTLANFSARGPDDTNSGYLVPSIVAPGVDIYAAHATRQPYENANIEFPPYRFESGTSMASPHVAGAMALISGIHPLWSPAEVQSALMLTATTLPQKSSANLGYYDHGAGRINVDKAVTAGLVLNESHDNYQDANPKIGGDIQTLNLPALVNQDCLLICSWTRTFRATQAGDWQVKGITNDAINLSVSPQSFSVDNNDLITLTISATAKQGYQGGDVSGHILIRSSNTDNDLGLPVIASFKKGTAPFITHITADSNRGSQLLPGITTLGLDYNADNIVVSHFGLHKIQKASKQIQRDDFDQRSFPFNVYNQEEALFSLPLTIPENSRYLQVNVLNTTSPDLDLYIGYDNDFDGKPSSASEMYNLICTSATRKTLESCTLEHPPAGDFFVAVHNFGDEDAPTGKLDDVELEIMLVGADDGTFSSSITQQLHPLTDIGFNLHWQNIDETSQQYMTFIELGSSAMTPSDIVSFPLRIARSEQSLSIGLEQSTVDAGENIELTLYLDANGTSEDKPYEFTLTVPSEFSIVSRPSNSQVDNQTLTVSYQHIAGAGDTTLSVVLQAPNVEQNQRFQIDYEYHVNGQSYRGQSQAFDVLVPPTAKINDEINGEITVSEGDEISLSGAQSVNPSSDSDLLYQWRRVSGPQITLTDLNSSEIRFNAPQVNDDQTLVIELTVISAGRTDSTQMIINIENTQSLSPTPRNQSNSTSGGGSLSWLLCLSILVMFFMRRDINRQQSQADGDISLSCLNH